MKYGSTGIPESVQSWMIIFYLLICSKILCSNDSPCPDVFKYRRDSNNELYGVIVVPSINSNQIRLEVELSVGNSVQGYNGRIEMAHTKQKVIEDVRYGRPIIYNVFFPAWINIPPKVTRISVNGNLLCYGPKLTFGIAAIISTVNLQHVLRVDVQTLTYPFSGNNFILNQDEAPNRDGDGRPPPPPPPGRGPPPDRPPPDVDVDDRPEDFHRRPPPEDNQRQPPLNGDDVENNRYNFNPGPVRDKPNRFNFRPEMPKDPNKVYNGNPFFSPTSEGTPLISSTDFSLFGSSGDSDEKSEVAPVQPNIEFASKNQNSDTSLDSICGISVATNQLVFGGTVAPRGSFPWLAALYGVTDRGLNYLCTASLISERHVVSAAHCVKIDNRLVRNSELLIILGKQNIQKWALNDGEKMVEPESIHVHPDYNTSTSDADVSVIVLSEKLEFTRYIRPLCLWEGNTDLHNIEGQLGTVVGWGKDENGLIMTSEPKQIQLPVVSQDECLRSSYHFKDITSSRTFCAGFRNGTGPCNGDSGGGFILKRNGRWMLRGIVSMSVSETHERTCNLKHFVIFTDASKHLKWIQSFLK